VQAGLAVPTRKGRLDRDSVPNLNAVHAVSDGDNDTDHLMAGVVGGFHESVLAVDASLVRTTTVSVITSTVVVATDNDASPGQCFGHSDEAIGIEIVAGDDLGGVVEVLPPVVATFPLPRAAEAFAAIAAGGEVKILVVADRSDH
jgi:hypothetical protein